MTTTINIALPAVEKGDAGRAELCGRC
jgi:hypothetical protein